MTTPRNWLEHILPLIEDEDRRATVARGLADLAALDRAREILLATPPERSHPFVERFAGFEALVALALAHTESVPPVWDLARRALASAHARRGEFAAAAGLTA